MTCSLATASINVISAIRRITKLALCSFGEAAPAKRTSASTKMRGLGGLFAILFLVVPFALFAEIIQELINAQAGFQTNPFDLVSQLRNHWHHRYKYKNAVKIHKAEDFPVFDIVLFTQFGRERDYTTFSDLNCEFHVSPSYVYLLMQKYCNYSISDSQTKIKLLFQLPFLFRIGTEDN